MAEAARLLSAARLLTLVGPGGTGKTRLALQVAADVVDQFAHGAWLVELAPLTDPGSVLRAVAQALGLRETGGRPLRQALEDYLRAKTLLLVLDNCEHLLDACARLADDLLRAAPGLKLMTTSREALGIGGETTYQVTPLDRPEIGRLPPVAALSQYEAVRLFIERAAAVQPGFAVTNANAPAVAQICHRLDGLPLALELAAARVRSLSPEEIAARLDDRFRLLTGGSRTALPRHQTLRAAIDWSHDLLTEGERVLLRRLSVFAGGWTLDAAERVTSDALPVTGNDGVDDHHPAPDTRPAPLAPPNVLDLLDRLVTRSLVTLDTRATAARYRMLETIRQYGLEKLAQAGEAEAVQARHLAHYLALSGEAAPHLRRGSRAAWQARLDAEHDNLRAAMEWALTARPPAAVEMGAHLWTWCSQDNLSEIGGWLRRGLEATAEGAPGRHHALATCALAEALFGSGGWQEAQPWSERALALARERGEAAAAAWALALHSKYHADHGHLEAAEAAGRESLALAEQAGDRVRRFDATLTLAHVAMLRQDFPAATRHAEDGLALARQAGDAIGEALALEYLLAVVRWQSDQSRAGEIADQILRLARALGQRRVVYRVQYERASAAMLQGEFTQARATLAEVIDLSRDLGDLHWLSFPINFAIMAAAAQGDDAEAERLSAESVSAARALNDKNVWADTYRALSFAAYHRGALEQAAADARQSLDLLLEVKAGPIIHGQYGRAAAAYYRLGQVAAARELVEAGLAGVGQRALDPSTTPLMQMAARLSLADGNLEQARARWRANLPALVHLGLKPYIAHAFEGLAEVDARQGQPARAARLLGAAEALRAQMRAPVPPVERAEYGRVVALVRDALEETAFSAAWTAGRAAGWEAAAAEALQAGQ
jgi:non-specific serine/threonine protein kinase